MSAAIATCGAKYKHFSLAGKTEKGSQMLDSPTLLTDNKGMHFSEHPLRCIFDEAKPRPGTCFASTLELPTKHSIFIMQP